MSMASYGATQRPNTTPKAATNMADTTTDSTAKTTKDSLPTEFKLVFPFNIPSSPESAALRIIKNLSHFSLYYTHFIWIILFITLIPQRKVALICLVIITYVASLYLLMLRAVPALQKLLDKRVVLPMLVTAAMVAVIANHAALHLVLTLVGAVPVVLIHAVLWVGAEGCVEERGLTGEMVPLVQESTEMV